MKKFAVVLLILAFSILIGFIAYKYILPIILYTFGWFGDKGPLGLLFIAAIGGVEALMAYIMSKVLKPLSKGLFKANTRGDLILSILGGVLAGGPITASLIINAWNNNLGSFTAFLYIAFNGVLLGFAVLMAIDHIYNNRD